MVRRRSWWGVGQEEEWRWQEGMGERILHLEVAWGTVTVSLPPHSRACLTLGWPPLKGGSEWIRAGGPLPNPTYINWGLFPPPGELSPSQENPGFLSIRAPFLLGT